MRAFRPITALITWWKNRKVKKLVAQYLAEQAQKPQTVPATSSGPRPLSSLRDQLAEDMLSNMRARIESGSEQVPFRTHEEVEAEYLSASAERDRLRQAVQEPERENDDGSF